MDLLPNQANDITVQHRLRECLQQHRPGQNESGIRVPVVAALREGSDVRYVRFGHQFCVRDVSAAIDSLKKKSFLASCSGCLID